MSTGVIAAIAVMQLWTGDPAPEISPQEMAVARALLADPVQRRGVPLACVRDRTLGSAFLRSENNTAIRLETARRSPADALIGFAEAPSANLSTHERRRINDARGVLENVSGASAKRIPPLASRQSADQPLKCDRSLSISTPEISGGVAFISVAMTCGDLCGEGGEVVMIRRNGRWQVTAFGPWWVS